MRRAANDCTIKDARQSVLDALGGILIGRNAEFEEPADLIAFPAAESAAAIHGAEIVIDAGQSARFNTTGWLLAIRGQASILFFRDYQPKRDEPLSMRSPAVHAASCATEV